VLLYKFMLISMFLC